MEASYTNDVPTLCPGLHTTLRGRTAAGTVGFFRNHTVMPLRPSLIRLPVPNDAEIRQFQTLHEQETGTRLGYAKARDQLTYLVQFYFLTKGHELHAHNERVRARQRGATPHTEVDMGVFPAGEKSAPEAR